MSHGHGHGHAPVRTRPPATGTAWAEGVGEVIGWVNARPIPRAPLDARLRELRDGPLSAALPVEGSSEDRQLARWLTQVILTEVLCEDEARACGLVPLEGPPLDRLAAVELGSINASAYNGSAWVRALFATVEAEVPTAWRAVKSVQVGELFSVRHALLAHPDEAATLEPLGAIELSSLPSAVAAEIRRQPYGMVVGPVQDGLGWHLAVATPAPQKVEAEPDGMLAAAQRRAFAQWLDGLRAEKVELVPGLEHPGDPRQPDNHHKH